MNSIKDKENSDVPFKINVLKEQLSIEKKLVEKATVEITKKVIEENETAAVDLFSEDVEITNVPFNTYVAVAPTVRHEGNTIIIPVLKEVLVVEKKLLLVEEIHITKSTSVKQHKQTVALKKQQVIINRTPSS